MAQTFFSESCQVHLSSKWTTFDVHSTRACRGTLRLTLGPSHHPPHQPPFPLSCHPGMSMRWFCSGSAVKVGGGDSRGVNIFLQIGSHVTPWLGEAGVALSFQGNAVCDVSGSSNGDCSCACAGPAIDQRSSMESWHPLHCTTRVFIARLPAGRPFAPRGAQRGVIREMVQCFSLISFSGVPLWCPSGN